MKPFPVLLALLLAPVLAARADTRPNFDDDAKPILRQQADLVRYVKDHFDVQETGYSRVPGTDDHAPPPPYIFRARPRGSDGPYTITLFIQPGPPGHILFVKAGTPPSPAYTGEPPSAPPPTPAYTGGPDGAPGYVPSNPAYTGEPPSQGQIPPPPVAEQPSAPQPPPQTPAETPPAGSATATPPANSAPPGFQGVSSSTPSGPIKSDSSSGGTTPPSLAPPPDPAPAPSGQ